MSKTATVPSLSWDACLKSGSLNLQPTHPLKPQVVLGEAGEAFSWFMSPREGKRGEKVDYATEPCCAETLGDRAADGLTPPGHITSPPLFSQPLSTAQDRFLFVPVVLGAQPQSLVISGFGLQFDFPSRSHLSSRNIFVWAHCFGTGKLFNKATESPLGASGAAGRAGGARGACDFLPKISHAHVATPGLGSSILRCAAPNGLRACNCLKKK